MQIDRQQEERQILNAYKALVRDCIHFTNKKQRKHIRKAFEFSLEAHKDDRRKSGEHYIFHPIAVARIVVKEVGLKDTTAVISALLHDVVEDTIYETADISREFGSTVAKIIDGLTKISGIFDHKSSAQAENFRKMLMTLSADIRVILIKFADRLHNMRTLEHMKNASQLKIASETQYLYAPLAHRMGLYEIKSELEDLSLKYTEPEVYNEIEQKIMDFKPDVDRIVRSFIRPIRKQLEVLGIQAIIKSRFKSISSINSKMHRQNIPFEKIFDLFAVRIIIHNDNPENLYMERALCRNVFDVVTKYYTPNQARTRDWLTRPRANGYESLHTTVMGPKGKWIEVQIRTERMDHIAESGMAAHWKYKENIDAVDRSFENWMENLKELLDNPQITALDFVQEFRSNLHIEEIFTFTPKGDMVIIPPNATVLDFAYKIHSKIGEKCIGAKINHQSVPISYQISNGEQIEILTSKNQSPQKEWLEIVKTSRAKSKITEYLKRVSKETRDLGEVQFLEYVNQYEFSKTQLGNLAKELSKKCKLNGIDAFYIKFASETCNKKILHDSIQNRADEQIFVNRGKTMFSWSVERYRLSEKQIEEVIKELKTFFQLNSPREFYFQLGCKNLKLEDLRDFIRYKKQGKKLSLAKEHQKENSEFESFLKKVKGLSSDMLVIGNEFKEFNYKVSDCCNPIPGEKIVGIIDNKKQINVHRTNCELAIEKMSSFGSRIVNVKWSKDLGMSFLVAIKIIGKDKQGMMNSLIQIISNEMKLNIRGITIDSEDGTFEGTFKVYVQDNVELNKLISNINNVSDVFSVYRVEH